MFYTLVKNYAKYDLPITEAPGCVILNYDLRTVFTKLFNIFYEYNVEAYLEPTDKDVKFYCKAFYNLKLLIYTISLQKYEDKISLRFENAGLMRGLFIYRLALSVLDKGLNKGVLDNGVRQHEFDLRIFLDLNNNVRYENIRESFIYLLRSDIKMLPPLLRKSLLRHINKGLLELNCLIMTTLSHLLEKKCLKLDYNLLCHIYFTILLHKESTILHNIVFNMVHNNLQGELPQDFKRYLTNYRCKNGKNVQLVHKILKVFK